MFGEHVTCKLCGTMVDSGERLVEHWKWEIMWQQHGEMKEVIVTHAEVKPLVEEVLFMKPKDIEEGYNVKKHHKTHYDRFKSSETFKCAKCEYTSFKQNDIYMHTNRKHLLKTEEDDEKSVYYCDECTYKCFRKDTFRMHKQRTHVLKTIENIEYTVQYCSECDYKCNRKKTLNVHKKNT